MKILFSMHHVPDPNAGVAGVTDSLARELKLLGHSVDMFSMADSSPGGETLKAHVMFPWSAARRLWRTHDHYDVLDLTSGDGWLFETFHRPVRQLVVARSHGLEHTVHRANLKAAEAKELKLSWKYGFYHGGFRLWEVATSFRRADLCLFLNKEDCRYAIEKLGVQAGKSHVVDNGVSDAYLRLPFATQVHSGLRIAVVGTYIHRKIHTMPAVIDRLLLRHPDWQISFLGTGVEEVVVRKDYSAGAQGQIAVVRRYDNAKLPQLLQGHDVLLFPSLADGFGIAVYEGMACGLALVAFALPALTERLQNEEEALLLPAGDNTAMEAALERLASDPALLLRLRQAGYERAQRFSWKRIALDTENLYREFLDAKLRRG